MTGFAETGGRPPKQPAPSLEARAPRPSVVRLRGSVVRGLALGGSALIAGALVWAFVIQPELRTKAMEAAGREARDEGRGAAVRPSALVADQPAAYDRLPPPRIGGEVKTDGEAPGTGMEAGIAAPPMGTSPAWRASPAPSSSGAVSPDTRELALRSSLFFDETGETAAAGGRTVEAAAAPERAAGAEIYNPNRLTAPRSPYEVKAGVLAPAVLLTAVDTARSGPVVAVVTRDVFDTVTGRHLLIPQGARLLGRSEGESRHGDNRAYLAWERLLLPNGKSLILADEPGVDAQGGAGVRGRVDRRLLPLAIGTVFAGAVTTLGQAARDRDRDEGGFFMDAGNAAANQGAQVGGRLVDRELSVRPSIRLEPGTPVGVLITRDLVLEPFEP